MEKKHLTIFFWEFWAYMFSDHFKAPTRMLLWQCLPGGTNSGGTSWICPTSLHPGALSPYKGGRVKGKQTTPLCSSLLFQRSKPFTISAIQKAAHSGAPWRSRIIFKKSWLSSQLRSKSWLDCILTSVLKSHWSEHKGHIFQKKQCSR